MQERWDQLQALLDATDATELRRGCARLVQGLGFEHWLHASGARLPMQPHALNAYPADWVEHYRVRGYLDLDPVLGHCRLHSTPCLWAADPRAMNAGYRTEYFREASDFGLRLGIGLPVHGPAGQASLLLVSCSDTARPVSNCEGLATCTCLPPSCTRSGSATACARGMTMPCT